MIKFTLNGETTSLEQPITVAALLDHYKMDLKTIAFEKNLTIIPKDAFHTEKIQDGDMIEIIHFIGGG